MPNYKKHLAGGALIFAIGLYFFIGMYISIFTALEWLGFSLLGSLFPDIDTKSKGQKIFYKILFFIIIYLFLIRHFFEIALLSILAMIPLISNHRAICHNIWFIMLMALGIIMCGYMIVPALIQVIIYDMLFFVLGAASHIWLDMGIKKLLRFG